MNWTIYYCKIETDKQAELFQQYNMCAAFESTMGITARTKKEAWEYAEDLMRELGPEYHIKAVKPNYDYVTLVR